jgi:diguanylate cyclase (GGDEF)-like protein
MKQLTASQPDKEASLDIPALTALILDSEEWLMARILDYAQRQNYTQYTSTLICAWRLSISGLSEALVAAAGTLQGDAIEFDADDDFRDNPLAQFAIEEALLHRRRGINLGMFLGLLKYYRQAYLDLLQENVDPPQALAMERQIIHRCFDLFEIALVSQWNSTSLDTIIEELRAANRSLTNEKNFYLTAYESLLDPAFLLNEDFEIIAANQAAYSLLAGTFIPAGEQYYRARASHARSSETAMAAALAEEDEADPLGESIFSQLPDLQGRLSEQAGDAPALHREVSLTLHGRCYEFLLSQCPMQDISGRYSGSVVFLTDITDRKIMEDELRDLSEHDPLTGAGNRRFLVKLAEAEFKRAKRYQWPVCAVAIDIDHFKIVNDMHGHAIGDKVLIQLAQTCMDLTREHDIFARTGGEEFVMVLPQTDPDKAEELVERLQAVLRSTPLETDTKPLRVTASFGIASATPGTTDIETLLTRADQALYAAKAAGRNCIKRADQLGL